MGGDQQGLVVMPCGIDQQRSIVGSIDLAQQHGIVGRFLAQLVALAS